jgi:predicted AlkP superfamily phosphohydrolase/phosphomutase
MQRKVLIIGIDGGCWAILRAAMQQGYMPHLAELVASGASGILKSTIPAITPAAWSSFQTGMNPGANGVYNFHRWDRKLHKGILVNSTSLSATIWDIASEAGKRVAVLNVPMTYPPRKVNGCMVTGILTPSIESAFTYPPDFKKALLEAVPDYQILNLEQIDRQLKTGLFESLVEQMVKNVDCRARAACFIIDNQKPDLFMAHFQESDVIQHGLWGYMDPEHPLYNPDRQRYLFENFYKLLDGKIKDIRRQFSRINNEDYLTLVVSDHGFQAHEKIFNLGLWLSQNGFVKMQLQACRSRVSLPVRMAKKIGIGKILRKFLSTGTVWQIEKNVKLKEEYADRINSRVHLQCCGGEGFIFLLEPDASQRQATIKELTEKLNKIKDSCTNSSVITAIYPKDKIYHGQYLEIMPDLVIAPADGYSFGSSYAAKEDLWQNVDVGKQMHIGKHHSDGIFIATGEGVKSQKQLNAHITDIAPTVLYYLGLPIRKDSDGAVIKDVFSQQFLQEHAIEQKSYVPPESQLADGKDVYSDKDEAQVQKRLKDLGYL